MPHSLLDARARDALRVRAARLQPTTPARWGRFTAPHMLAHAIQSLRMMTGELAVPVERVLHTIGARERGAAWPTHPAFGPTSGRESGVLQYRHLDHHFRQFGL